MIAVDASTVGQSALALALLAAAIQACATFARPGAVRPPRRRTTAAAWAQCGFVVLAYAVLTHAFAGNDFSLRYVATHSNSALPLVYRITAVWGGHEGSILLWALILAGWTAAVCVFGPPDTDRAPGVSSRILGVMGLVSCGFLAFTLWASDPFERLSPVPPDGLDLTPLLQDPGMVIHPPMLYMGYVGFVVAFAFAVAALVDGRLDATWARWSRPWTLVAWGFLTGGIALGSFWAYYELGWGGWWFWDPVENASLMPWLCGTALIHSLAVTEKRGAFRAWTALLAIATFALSLTGTFLVRSGVLSSVHAFAADPRRGLFILVLLAIVIGASLALFAWRAPKIGTGGRFEPVSRESMLLANNVLLLVACAAVLLGTLYPLMVDALGGGKLSVGPPYFEAVFVPLMAPALLLMGVGPLARWQRAEPMQLARDLRWPLGTSLLAAVGVPLALGRWSPWVAFGLLLATWIGGGSIATLVRRLRNPSAGASAWRRATAQSGSFYGMLLAHFGVAVFIVGVTIVGGYAVERDVRMAPGEVLTLGSYRFRFEGVREVGGPNYVAAQALLTVTRHGEPLTELRPERRLYGSSDAPMTETAIHRHPTRDLYVALGEPVGPLAWSLRIYYKPFVGWIWAGCLLMALGGALAAFDRRYRHQHASGRIETTTPDLAMPMAARGTMARLATRIALATRGAQRNER